MKYIIFILLFIPAMCIAQQEINKPDRATYYVAYDSINDVYHAGITLPNQVTTSGQPSLTFSADELEFLSQTDNIPVEYQLLPSVGEQVELGIYEFEGKLVICRQAHIRTIFNPADTPALFAVYRAEEPDAVLEWIVGELVYVGTRRSYNDVMYECIQQHQTVQGQTPDLTPALWNEVSDEECPAWVQPTGAQDAYPLGACVTHNGFEWINTGSNANVWEPGVFGWEQQ